MLFRKFILLLLLGLVTPHLQAQIKIASKNYDQSFRFDFDAKIGSALNNDFIYKLANGGFIDNSIKDKNLNRLRTENLFGQAYNSGIYYSQENRKIGNLDHLGFQLGIQWHYRQELVFSQDLFELLFYGNYDFINQKADVSTAYSSLNYTSLKMGLNKTFLNNKLKIAANLNLNFGHSMRDFNIENGQFYTSINSDSLVLSGAKQMYNAPDFSLGSNFGFGLDFWAEYQHDDFLNIKLKLENFGKIKWKKDSRKSQFNEDIIWNGLEVDNLLNLPSPLMKSSASDSLNNFLQSNSRYTIFQTNTPALLSLSADYQIIKSILWVSADIQHLFYSHAKTAYALQALFILNDQIQLGPKFHYGGYSGFNYGFNLKYEYNTQSSLSIGSQYIGSLISKKAMSGIGGFITFTYKI